MHESESNKTTQKNYNALTHTRFITARMSSGSKFWKQGSITMKARIASARGSAAGIPHHCALSLLLSRLRPHLLLWTLVHLQSCFNKKWVKALLAELSMCKQVIQNLWGNAEKKLSLLSGICSAQLNTTSVHAEGLSAQLHPGPKSSLADALYARPCSEKSNKNFCPPGLSHQLWALSSTPVKTVSEAYL